MKTSRLSANSGFSLVEVVHALGIATIGLVSILGLLNSATLADSGAGRDTTVVAMANYVLNDLHAVPFDALWAADPTLTNNWNAGPRETQAQGDPTDTIYYFTNEGAAIPAGTAASNPDLLYKCIVHKTIDADAQNIANANQNRLKLQIEFSWPAVVDSNPPTTGKAGHKTFYASIARR